jgi:hypothetical protein
MKIDDAAKELQRSIPAPAGTVSTLACDQVIRLYIEPSYWGRISVPATYKGFRVIATERSPTFAFAV